MDMPGRGLYDERDSGIARSGKLMRLRSKAQIDLHLVQLSISLLMHPDIDLGSVKDKDAEVTFLCDTVFLFIYFFAAGISASQKRFFGDVVKKKKADVLFKS